MIKKPVTLLLITIFYSISFGQGNYGISFRDFKIKGNPRYLYAWKKLDAGNYDYLHSNFESALDNYLEAIIHNPVHAGLNYRIGICYRETSQPEKAIEYLTKSYELDPLIAEDIDFWLGRLHQLKYEFDTAREYFKAYFRKSEDPKIGLDRYRYLEECVFGKKSFENAGLYPVLHPEEIINTEDDEYFPIYCSRDSMLFFTSVRYTDSLWTEQIYMLKYGGKSLDQESLFNPHLFTADFSNYGISFISDDMSYMILVGCGTYVSGRCNLYQSERRGAKWLLPEKIEGISTYERESYAAVNENRDEIYFTRIDKKGNSDIYYSGRDTKTDQWNKPSKFKAGINTKYSEIVLSFRYDTLYFVSDGLIGLGGFDIYMTVKDSIDNSWSDPINMGYPINTPFDEFGFSKSEDYIFISSDRNNSLGQKDIFIIDTKEKQGGRRTDFTRDSGR